MVRLKPLQEQVVVILGASSGIGRETALQCAARGARVVVAARGEPGLVSLVEEIEAAGGEATYVVCDASDEDQVLALADMAIDRFGRIDTWVNNAAIGVYGKFEDIPSADFRRVLDVNVLGYVHGAKAALPHLRRAGGGALIFISSIESTIGTPLQTAYATSKHAVQGMTETLRRELLAEGAPISVTSIKPAVINTPFYRQAHNLVGFQPTAPPPSYHPAVVADCILYAAEHPVRDMYAGGSARAMALLQLVAPGLFDVVLGKVGIPLQRTRKPVEQSSFHQPRHDTNRVTGDVGFHTFRFSPYTWLQTHPKAKTLATIASAGVVGSAIARRRS